MTVNFGLSTAFNLTTPSAVQKKSSLIIVLRPLWVFKLVWYWVFQASSTISITIPMCIPIGFPLAALFQSYIFKGHKLWPYPTVGPAFRFPSEVDCLNQDTKKAAMLSCWRFQIRRNPQLVLIIYIYNSHIIICIYIVYEYMNIA